MERHGLRGLEVPRSGARVGGEMLAERAEAGPVHHPQPALLRNQSRNGNASRREVPPMRPALLGPSEALSAPPSDANCMQRRIVPEEPAFFWSPQTLSLVMTLLHGNA
eukprot:RCo039094